MLADKTGGPFRPARAVLWSVGWALGAGIGVALGGWLTLAGGSGAPGAEAIDPTLDLVILPAVAAGIVFVAHAAFQVSVAAIRGRAQQRTGRDGEDDEH